MKTYDILVLGGGTGGTAAAKTAADAGASVAMFNDGELGGLCILRGCMPTKTLLHAAHLAHEARHSATPGISVRGADVDFAAVMSNKDAKVERFKRAKIAGIERGGYEVIDARARFTAPDTVEAGGETYRFEKGAIIATGSVTHVPPIPGLADVPYVTSDEVMRLTEQPESIIVLGSGAIGLELGQFFSRIGTRVHLVSRRKVLSDVDPLLVDEMEQVLRAEPDFELVHPVAPRSVARTEAGVRVELADDRVLEAQMLVLATGRRAALDDLGLDAAGVAVEGGRVVCGPDMRTTSSKVFVAGDASGERLLLHVANWEGRVAGLNAVEGSTSHRVEQRLHMTVVFTDPAVATLGMNEAQAREAGLDVVTAHEYYAQTGRAITQDVAHGVGKLVATRDTGELVGAQLLGPRADDLIHELAAVMYYRGKASDMLEMPWYHPTLSEVFLGLARELQAQVSGA